MPTRLEFYENWLHATGMRDGRIGLAPLAAVLSFLRQEGDPYDLVVGRAGAYAAQWTFDNLSSVERSFIRSLPTALRARMAVHIAKRVIRRSHQGGRSVSRLRRGQGTITMRNSVFCSVREPVTRPLCGYYAAALARALALVSVNGDVHVQSCQGVGAPACVIAMRVLADQTAPQE